MTKIGIVGCGGWGQNWVKEAQRQGVLAAVCDSRIDQLPLALSSQVETYTDLDTFLSNKGITAVVVATPAETHREVAQKVIAKGKHILIEKPLATSLKEAQLIAQSCENTDLVAMVGHLMLYHPAISWIKNFIASGELGQLYYMTARRLNLGKIRQNENAIWSFAPHDLSVAFHIFGESPSNQNCLQNCFLQETLGVADVGFVHLEFPSGGMFHGHFSWLDPAKRREMVFVGSKKMIVFEDAESQEKIKVFDKGAVTSNVGHPIIGDEVNEPNIFSGDVLIPALSLNSPLSQELKAFLAAIEGDSTKNLSPLSQGVEVIRVLEEVSPPHSPES